LRGWPVLGAIGKISANGWEAVLRTNLLGTFLMARECFTQWMSSHGGAIVNMLADIWGGMPGMGQRFDNESALAAAVTFLLSDAASFINGSVIRVDGGVPNAALVDLAPAARTNAFDGFPLYTPPAGLQE
jgi:citronellol/citronellal dehydrogenase